MNNSIHRISLDIHDTGSQVSISAKKGDTARSIYITLTENGKPYRIAEGCHAVFTGVKPDKNYLFNDCTIEGNVIIYDFTEQTVPIVGQVHCEITLYDTENEKITSPRFDIVVDDVVYNDEEIVSSKEANALITAIAEAKAITAEVEQKLDNGDFVGEQGPKGDKGDTGPIGPRGPQGVKGDSYNLTEADKSDIAKLINVDSKQDKFADVTERDGAVILTSTVSDDRPPQAILKNGELELWAMRLQFGDGQGEVSLKGLNAPDDSLNINANDSRIRNVADPKFDKDAVNKKYFERNLPSVDQAYNPDSSNAQSGIAVAEAFDKQELKHIKTITLTEAVTNITTYFDKPLKEFYIRFIGSLDGITANVSDVVLCARTNEGGQYFCWSPYVKFTPTEDKAFFIHAKEIIPRQWESEFPIETIGVTKNAYGYLLQGISSNSANVRKSFSTRLAGHIPSRYVEYLDFFTSNNKYSFAVGSVLEIWGVEVDE